jgi:hypothetical protein
MRAKRRETGKLLLCDSTLEARATSRSHAMGDLDRRRYFIFGVRPISVIR